MASLKLTDGVVATLTLDAPSTGLDAVTVGGVPSGGAPTW